MAATDLEQLVEAADVNALLRAVDSLCEKRDWDALLDLAEKCEWAVERGKQLWPITAHIDYRVALEAPGEYAAGVLEPGVGRFAHGPLTEVAASTHSWEELAPYIDIPQVAAYVAHERVLRGEVLEGDERVPAGVLELPARLEPWEPTYALATFKSSYVEVAEPWEPRSPLSPVEARPGLELHEPEMEDTLLDLVTPWTAESNGAARAVVVEGDAAAAAASIAGNVLRMGPLEAGEALQRMAWAAAAGGAHGRRRGAALGRFMAWYTAALLADAPWPLDPDELGRLVNSLEWHRWDEGEPEKGWVLRMAIASPEHGWAAAIGATDVLEEEDVEEDAQ